MSVVPRRAVALAAAVLLSSSLAGMPAYADHTDPDNQLAGAGQVPGVGNGGARTTGPGTWAHLANFPGVLGTDLEFFRDGANRQFVSTGSLGQGRAQVGQRVIRLTNAAGDVDPAFERIFDHGSANCDDVTGAGGTTGLQHDVQVTPVTRPLTGPQPAGRLLIDTTDQTSRCHDPAGGGLEIIDISGMGTAGFEVREIGLTRHNGWSHTVTADATRPWLLYNNSSDGSGNTFIDVLDIRSCLNTAGMSLEQKRAACRPVVKRMDVPAQELQPRGSDGTIPSDPPTGPDGMITNTGPAGPCHDATARPGRIHCAALDASVIINVAGLTNPPASTTSDAVVPIPANNDPAGDIQGAALPCTLIENSTRMGSGDTDAMVTDCSLGGPTATGASGQAAYNAAGRPQATGWSVEPGGINHAVTQPANQAVSLSHEFDPSPDGTIGFVTDERGGGVAPPGAACLAPGVQNPSGNGGIHAFDLTAIGPDGDHPYLLNAAGAKAIFRSTNTTPSPTFCTTHVIEQLPDENRIVTAYYTQGVKLVDYAKDSTTGALTFTETASFQLPGANTWASEVFKTVENSNGTRTYFFVATDIDRGVDIYSYNGPRATGQAPAEPEPVIPEVPVAVVLPVLAAGLIGGAMVLRRRRTAGALVG